MAWDLIMEKQVLIALRTENHTCIKIKCWKVQIGIFFSFGVIKESLSRRFGEATICPL